MRRRIQLWIRGASSPSEADTLARHLEICAACAADASLEYALRRLAHAAEPERATPREDLWAQIEAARLLEPKAEAAGSLWHGRGEPCVRKGRALGSPLRSAKAALALAAIPLAVALHLTGGADRTDPGVEPVSPAPAGSQSVSAELLLWGPRPPMSDPLGPTTESLLNLLEGES
jgi:hypothetical protein